MDTGHHNHYKGSWWCSSFFEMWNGDDWENPIQKKKYPRSPTLSLVFGKLYEVDRQTASQCDMTFGEILYCGQIIKGIWRYPLMIGSRSCLWFILIADTKTWKHSTFAILRAVTCLSTTILFLLEPILYIWNAFTKLSYQHQALKKNCSSWPFIICS